MERRARGEAESESLRGNGRRFLKKKKKKKNAGTVRLDDVSRAQGPGRQAGKRGLRPCAEGPRSADSVCAAVLGGPEEEQEGDSSRSAFVIGGIIDCCCGGGDRRRRRRRNNSRRQRGKVPASGRRRLYRRPARHRRVLQSLCARLLVAQGESSPVVREAERADKQGWGMTSP